MVVEPVFGFLLAYDPVIAVTVYSVVVLFLINIFYRILVKQNEAKELKARSKELNKKMREEQKAGNKDAATKLMSEMMQQNSKLMKLTMKPMIISFIIVIIFLPFLSSAYPDVSVAITNNTGNFTLGGNDYIVTKNGNDIILSGAENIQCTGECLQKVDNKTFKIHNDGENVKLSRIVAMLPIALPIFGSAMSWLGWYIIVSVPLVILLRKIMKIYT